MQYKILFVDDESANLRLLERLFRNDYEVFSAASGPEALELLALHDFALIVSDQRMPGMTGIEFLMRAAEIRPQTVRIMLTGYTDAGALVDALNSGVVYKYVAKPWINEDFQQNVKRALQHYETLKAQRSLQLQNERLQTRLKATRDGFVEAVNEMLELKFPDARVHARRTADYAAQIGCAVEMDRLEVDELMLAALLHEAAMLYIPSDIARKEDPLTQEEQQALNEKHEAGLEMISRIPDLLEVTSNLRFYYENFDGSGHPRGFAGEQIPVHTRILAIASAYTVMRTPRPGRSALSHVDAVASIKAGAGKRFDPSLVAVFCALKTEPAVMDNDWELVGA